MLDISWTEFLLIGVVALIVIGPKELPAVLRTLGQWTRKLRSMAAEFQSQFHEAMREAEMADLKKQVDDIAQGVKNYDPLKEVRADLEAAGSDIQASLEKPAPTTSASATNGQDAAATAKAPVATEETAQSAPELPAPAAATAGAPPSSDDAAGAPETAGRAG